MYLEHYGLTEAPFRITPHTDFFFSGANRGATLEALLYAITHDEGIVKISGEVGSGKTMLCRVLMERLPENVVIIYLANPSLSREDILYALADELGIKIPENSRAGTVMRALQENLVGLYAEGKQVVVLIDEAHAMPMETLEEIRLLSNLESNRHKLLQLVLFGQPEINETLARSDMRQLRERITHNFNLEPLVRDDIAQYLDFRMRAASYRGPSVFAPEALKLITKASQGLTRRINILADKALLASFAAGSHQVGAKEAKAAIKDADFSDSQPAQTARSLPAGLFWAAAGALAMLALTGVWRLVAQPAGDAPATTPTHIAPAVAAAPPSQPTQPIAQPTPPASTPPAEAAFPPATPTIRAPTATPEVTAIRNVQKKPDTPAKATPTPLLDRLLAESRPWLDSVAENHWFLQLYSTEHPDRVEIFLKQAQNSNVESAQLRVYHSNLGDISRYGIVYGDYASRKDAVKGLDALPVELMRNRPYVRQAIQLKPDSNTRSKK
jgi:type II secretory pathway predicted ATPase ExeA